MPSLMNDLMDILGEQAENYENLCGLSKEKKDVIINNDTKALQTITSLENTLLGKHQRLEKKRISVTKDIATVLGRTEEELTLSVLSGLLEGKPEHPRMEEICERIRKAVPELKAVNEQNRLLIDSFLAYIEYTVNLIRGSLAGEPSFYPVKGDAGPAVKALFDVKQ